MTDRWHIIIGWMPQVPDYDDLKYGLVPAVAYIRCLGCGLTGQCRATERQWTPGASKRQFRLIQRQLCVKCHYDPDEAAMPVSDSVSPDLRGRNGALSVAREEM